MAITPDGKRIISGSNDKTLRIWNLETIQEDYQLSGHTHRITALAVTPDGKRAISGSGDATLEVWNLEQGEELFSFTQHRDSINDVKVTQDRKYIVSTSQDSTLMIWNLHSGKEIVSFVGESPIRCCGIAPDGLTIVAGEESGRVHFLGLEGLKLV